MTVSAFRPQKLLAAFSLLLALPTIRAAEIAGTYALTDDIPLIVKKSDAGLTMQIGKGEPHPLQAGSGIDHWTAAGMDLEVAPRAGGLALTRYGQTVVIQSTSAAKLPAPRSAEAILDDLAPRLMIAWNVPGVSAVGIEGGRIAWKRQYGVKAAGSTDPVNEGTIFEACSMSKPVFGYAMLKLVEQGQFGLDTPLVKYLGHPYIPGEPLHEKITARMALTHTGGMPNWRPRGRRDDIAALTVDFEPGTKFQYSGEGIWFLQRSVEKVTGQPLAEWMKSRLLGPVGMTSSSYVWKDKEYPTTAAAGHDEAGAVKEKRNLYRAGNAAYSLYTTPTDYAKFLIEVMKPNRSAPWSLGRKVLDEALSTRVEIPRNDSHHSRLPGVNSYWCLGWSVTEDASGTSYGHGGSNGTGFRCTSKFDPRTGNGIVIMTNADNGTEVWRSLVAAIHRP